jgi:hypothetical protein
MRSPAKGIPGRRDLFRSGLFDEETQARRIRSLPWTRSSSRRLVLLIAKSGAPTAETFFSSVLLKRPLESI